MDNCDGCIWFKREPFEKNRMAARCFAPLPPPWGNGRVIGNPAPQLLPKNTERPKWCERKEKK